jgi:hypothetical protein
MKIRKQGEIKTANGNSEESKTEPQEETNREGSKIEKKINFNGV